MGRVVESSLNRPLVLVVDDQEGIRKLLEAALGAEGYAVLSAVNGKEALERLAASLLPPSLAFVDMRMPVMDGARTLMALKERYPALPVVIMTAVGDVDQEAELEALGAARTIGKPFDMQKIRALTAELLVRAEEVSGT